MDKIVSSYQVVYGSQMDEDVILSKCRNAISCIEKVDKEIGTNVNSGIPALVNNYLVSILELIIILVAS